MNDKPIELVEQIYKIYKSRGFVREEEVLEFATDGRLSLFDINWLTEMLLGRGVVIIDETADKTHRNNDEDEYDASQIDYNELFDKVIASNPELKDFIEYVRKIQPPQLREWIGLMPQAKNGNKWAYDRLFEMNLRVVIKTAKSFSDKYHVALPDAIQNGCLGLMYAIDKFDQSEINSFSGYITRPIFSHIKRYADFTYSPLFYFPVPYQENLYKIFELIETHHCESCAFRKKYDCNTLLTQISVELDCSLLEAMGYLNFFTVFDQDICNIEGDISENPFDLTTRIDLKRVVTEVVSKLTPKEAMVLRMRFGFENDSPMNLEEVGVILGGVTRERVRQIEKKALEKLRKPRYANRLRSLVE